MRTFKAIWSVLGGSAACAAAYLLILWQSPPSSAPVASVALVGYTNISLSNSDTNVFVYPGRGNWLRAQMRLKNQGIESISYAAWGDEPCGSATAVTSDGETNGYLAPHFTGGIAVLPAGTNATFWVCLPPNTVSWRCSFRVETASVRERAYSKVCKTGVWPMFQPFCGWALRRLPDKSGPELEVKSGPFKIIEHPSPSAHNE
jgi:hypothetical protein